MRNVWTISQLIYVLWNPCICQKGRHTVKWIYRRNLNISSTYCLEILASSQNLESPVSRYGDIWLIKQTYGIPRHLWIDGSSEFCVPWNFNFRDNLCAGMQSVGWHGYSSLGISIRQQTIGDSEWIDNWSMIRVVMSAIHKAILTWMACASVFRSVFCQWTTFWHAYCVDACHA